MGGEGWEPQGHTVRSKTQVEVKAICIALLEGPSWAAAALPLPASSPASSSLGRCALTGSTELSASQDGRHIC